MTAYQQLRTFRIHELLLNKEETRTVLPFIFEPGDHGAIDALTISDSVRGFAQALLVEAIDASYAVGFVEALTRSAANPTEGAIDILKRFGRLAASHWFVHAGTSDLQDVRVYEFVRLEIARRFRTQLRLLATTATLILPTGAFVAYRRPPSAAATAWG